MRLIRNVLFILCGLICWSVSGNGQQIRIMSYNIHHGKDAEGVPTLDSIAAYIAGARVDLVGLQEVDSICHRSEQVDQVAKLGKRSDMDHFFTRHFAFQGGAYGQGLLSSLPVRNLRNFRLPVFPLEQGTEVSMLLADVHPQADMELTVGVVHLDYRSPQSRLHQVDILLDSLSGIRNLILLGDFNAYPDAPEMKKLLVHFDRYTTEPELPSFPTSNPDRRIDFVLVKKGSDIRIVDEYIPEVPFSDHLPVITTLEISKN